MPIPKNPNELRDLLYQHFDMNSEYPDERSPGSLADAAMAALMEYDPCFAKAASLGEPTFTLRAQDQISENTVWFWMELAEQKRIHADKIAGARAITAAIRAWQASRR